MINGTVYTRRKQAGLTYVECLISVTLLAVCLPAAMQAMTANFYGSTQNIDIGYSPACVQDALERTVAQSYSDLSASATSQRVNGVFTNPTAYSLTPGIGCPDQRKVFILPYDPTLADPFATTSKDMLYIRVEQTNGAVLATLAVRQ